MQNFRFWLWWNHVRARKISLKHFGVLGWGGGGVETLKGVSNEVFKGTLGDVHVNSTTSLLLYTKNCIMCWLSCLLCYSYEGHKVVGSENGCNFGRYARGAENDVPVLVIGHVQIQALIYTFERIKPLISKISSGMKTKWSYYIAQVVVADYNLNNWATPISISTIHTEISENNSAGSKDWFQMNYDTNIDHSNSLTYLHLHDITWSFCKFPACKIWIVIQKS